METESWDEIEDKIPGNEPAEAIRDETTSSETIVRESDKTTTSETDSASETAEMIPQVQQDNNSDEEDDDGIEYKMSTNKDAGKTAIRVIMFSGKPEEFPFWMEKYKAKTQKKNYKGHLLKTVGEIPESDYDIDGDTNLSDDEKTEKKKLKNDNKNAFSDLLMSRDYLTLQGKIAFRLVPNFSFPCRGRKTPLSNHQSTISHKLPYSHSSSLLSTR
jgi:hypothetical protein